jgi:hypothetical protein
MDGGGEVLEGAAALLPTGLDHRQHRFHEAATGGALCAEGKLAPDDGVTQRAFARVVRRFDAFATDEGPEPVAMLVQFPTHADQRRIAAFHTAQPQTLHLAADWRHATNERGATDRAVAVVCPVLEQLARRRTGPSESAAARASCDRAAEQSLLP